MSRTPRLEDGIPLGFTMVMMGRSPSRWQPERSGDGDSLHPPSTIAIFLKSQAVEGVNPSVDLALHGTRFGGRAHTLSLALVILLSAVEVGADECKCLI